MFSNDKFSSVRVPASVLVGLLLTLGACQSSQTAAPSSAKNEPKRAELSSQVAETAQVVAVDPSTRTVTVRGDDGLLVRLKAGDAVRNFDQIAIGDKLRVVYRDTLTASLRPAGERATPVEAAAVAGRAEAGAKPGAGVGLLVSVRVKIESIDRAHNLVVFSSASGTLIARRIVTPEGREFVDGLKVGDTVQLDYAEAFAVSIDKL